MTDPENPIFSSVYEGLDRKYAKRGIIPEYSGDGFWCLAVLDIEISRNRALKSKQVRKKALDERDIQGFFLCNHFVGEKDISLKEGM